MIKLIVTTTAILIGAISSAQVSENRKVSDFSKIKASNAIEVYFTQSNSQSIKVETDDNEKMKYIKTEIEGETLRVYVDSSEKKDGETKRKKWKNYTNNINFKTLKVYVTAPKVSDFHASSSASILLENKIDADNINLKASSSGSITGKIECENATMEASSSATITADVITQKLDVKVSSSADATISGTATDVVVKASSSAECNGKKLIAKNALVDASSSATVTINASSSLNAEASSSADVYYYGNPTNVTISKTSSGEITKK